MTFAPGCTAASTGRPPGMKPRRLRQSDRDERREDVALIRLVNEREAADSGERFTLEQAAVHAGIALDEL
jgi:hypothetical protein